MTEDNPNPTAPKGFLLFLRALSIVFMGIGFALSPYILYRYGLSVGPVYDRVGHVIGHMNYFVFSVFFSAFWVFVSWLSYRAAQKALTDLRASE